MEWTSKERILAAMEHRPADRVPIWESFWGSTLERWRQEGFPEGADPVAYFGLDETNITAIDWTCQFPVETIEETEDYVVVRTSDGVLSRSFKGRDTTPYWWDFPLTDRASWEELRPRMTWNPYRINLPAAKAAFDATRNRYQIYFPACLGFERFKYIMGMEGILTALGDDPGWVQEMCMSTAELDIEGLECLLGEGFEFDAAFVTEDMGYRDRAFFSPRTYREVIMPCQQRFCDFCHARGIRVMLHSCGQNMELVSLYVEAGFDALNPLEVKAGMDLRRLKREFGDVLMLWGGIDVRAIADPDPAVLEREIAEKVPMARQGGGYLFSSDHSIPSNVSLRQYERMLELGRHYGRFE